MMSYSVSTWYCFEFILYFCILIGLMRSDVAIHKLTLSCLNLKKKILKDKYVPLSSIDSTLKLY